MIISRRKFLRGTAAAGLVAVTEASADTIEPDAEALVEHHARELAKAMKRLHPAEPSYRFWIDKEYGQALISPAIKRGTLI